MVFHNKLVYRAPRTRPTITPEVGTSEYYDLNITLTCTVSRKGRSILGEFIGPINAEDAGFGHLTFSLDLYKDSNFAQTYSSDEFPVMIDEGQTVYVAASTLSIADVRLSVESCQVTPTRDRDDFRKHTIIDNGYVGIEIMDGV